MARLTRYLATLGTCSLLLGACTDGVEPSPTPAVDGEPSPGASHPSTSAPALIVGRVVSRAPAAHALTGTITVQNGCVVLDSDGTMAPIVWPLGSSIEPEDVSTVVLANGTVGIGEDIGAATGWSIALDELPSDATGVQACSGGDWTDGIVISTLRDFAMTE